MAKRTNEIYEQLCRIYDTHAIIKRALIKKSDPDTGGNEMLCHNWGNDDARRIMDERNIRMEKIQKLFNERYKIAFAQEYPDHISNKK